MFNNASKRLKVTYEFQTPIRAILHYEGEEIEEYPVFKPLISNTEVIKPKEIRTWSIHIRKKYMDKKPLNQTGTFTIDPYLHFKDEDGNGMILGNKTIKERHIFFKDIEFTNKEDVK